MKRHPCAHGIGDPALHHAVRSGNPRLVRLLLQAGARIESVDVLGDTAFDVASDDPAERDAVLAVLQEYRMPPNGRKVTDE